MRKYSKNNDKSFKHTIFGFTLVELLAVIVILAIILIIGVPSLVGSIKGKKQVASNQVYDLIKSAARNYEIDYDVREKQALEIKELCERYIECPIIDPATNEEIDGFISIGDGEYSFINAIKLKLNLNGGTTSQSFKERYPEHTIIELLNPTKIGHTFNEWSASGEGSSLNDKVLTMGTGDVELIASWTINTYTITYDLDGGSVSDNPTSGEFGSTITINSPTKTGYVFNGWTVSGTGSLISGTNLTIGAGNVTLTANWTAKVITVTFNKNDGSGSIASQTFTYGVSGNKFGYNTDGTAKWGTSGQFGSWNRSGYILLGWSKTSTATTKDYSVYSGVSDSWIDSNYPGITLYAVWGEKFLASYSCANGSAGSTPYNFTYTGNCTIIDDGNNNWRVKFLTSGTFKSNVSTNIDIFLVGGGGGGGHSGETGGGGGGGGYTLTKKAVNIIDGNSYTITIGAGGGVKQAGGTTSAFGFSASGGAGGAKNGGAGGSGGGGGGYPPGGTGGLGAGGAGGSNGGNGGTGGGGSLAGRGGSGQGTTTREFGESNGDLYSGGGGGGAGRNAYAGEVNPCCGGSGGSGGGGRGGYNSTDSYINGVAGTANTGGGGGGGRGYCYNGAVGGSGIVVIRNAR